MKDNIFNIFVYTDENNHETYLYSKKVDDLGYEYHILMKSQNDDLIDKQIPNIIQIFQNQNIHITEVKKDVNDSQYLRFLVYYDKVQELLKNRKQR